MKPIPLQMLRHTATLFVPDDIDEMQAPQGKEFALSRVCVQQSRLNKFTDTDHDSERKATLFFDAILSKPRLDWLELKKQADAAGGQMTVTTHGITMQVMQVDAMLDDHGCVHHYEVGLR